MKAVRDNIERAVWAALRGKVFKVTANTDLCTNIIWEEVESKTYGPIGSRIRQVIFNDIISTQTN